MRRTVKLGMEFRYVQHEKPFRLQQLDYSVLLRKEVRLGRHHPLDATVDPTFTVRIELTSLGAQVARCLFVVLSPLARVSLVREQPSVHENRH